MKESRRRALVLSLAPRGEQDATLEVLSAEGGREFFIARGLRGSRRRFAGLDLFSVAALELSRNRYGAELAEAALLRQPQRLARDHRAYALACADVEWARLYLRPGEGGDFLPLLEAALSSLDEGVMDGAEHACWWLLFLAAFGFAPELWRCPNCGAALGEEGGAFDPAAGIFLCPTCGRGDSFWLLDGGLLRSLQRAAKSDIRQLPRLKLSRQAASQAPLLLLRLGEIHAGRTFRSAGFLHQVLGLKGRR